MSGSVISLVCIVILVSYFCCMIYELIILKIKEREIFKIIDDTLDIHIFKYLAYIKVNCSFEYKGYIVEDIFLIINTDLEALELLKNGKLPQWYNIEKIGKKFINDKKALEIFKTLKNSFDVKSKLK